MSELTKCNYCNLRYYKQQAKKEGKLVTLIAGNDGYYIHIHGKDEPIDKRAWDNGNKQIVAWLMVIPDFCMC